MDLENRGHGMMDRSKGFNRFHKHKLGIKRIFVFGRMQ